MKIYISHSMHFDYVNELYMPLKSSSLSHNHELIIPHENNIAIENTKDLIKSSDYVVAEVSYPSTGVGIELGWADDLKTPIICVYKEGVEISRSLTFITNRVFSYKSPDDMVEKLLGVVNR